MPSSRLAAQVAIVLALAACHRGPALPDGDIAASLASATTLEAKTFDPAPLHGKPSLVMFVTPTCPHCLATIPRGGAAAQAEGANVVAVFVAGRAENAAGVISHAKFAGTALVDDGTLLHRYKIEHVPYTLVLGGDGHARDAYIGEQEESTLRDAIASAK